VHGIPKGAVSGELLFQSPVRLCCSAMSVALRSISIIKSIVQQYTKLANET